MVRKNNSLQAQFSPFIDWLRANKVSRATGYRLRKAGKLHTFNIGKRTYITVEEAQRFLNEQLGILSIK